MQLTPVVLPADELPADRVVGVTQPARVIDEGEGEVKDDVLSRGVSVGHRCRADRGVALLAGRQGQPVADLGVADQVERLEGVEVPAERPGGDVRRVGQLPLRESGLRPEECLEGPLCGRGGLAEEAVSRQARQRHADLVEADVPAAVFLPQPVHRLGGGVDVGGEGAKEGDRSGGQRDPFLVSHPGDGRRVGRPVGSGDRDADGELGGVLVECATAAEPALGVVCEAGSIRAADNQLADVLAERVRGVDLRRQGRLALLFAVLVELPVGGERPIS